VNEVRSIERDSNVILIGNERVTTATRGNNTDGHNNLFGTCTTLP